jgi:alpha-tubulin suppressor-like RCC1 family protein
MDGTDPTLASSRYTVPIVVSANTTIKAKAFLAGYTESAIATATFAITGAGQSVTPTITPRGGWYDTTQDVTITATAGATVRYTLTGVDPTTSDPVVPAGGLTIDRSQHLKVRAWETGATPSAVARADYAITGAVAAGSNHTLVLTAAGVLWAWGVNGVGQVGDGTAITRDTPVQVMTNVAAIAAAGSVSLAAKRDGTLWRWGQSIGATPTQVSGLTNVVAVAAGIDHFLALRSDGTLWAWGDNTAGQLGDGTNTTRTTPVQVLGLHGVRRIAAGDDFSVAVEDDGAGEGWVWAWGLNADGQLGDGTTLSRNAPTRVPNLSGVSDVAAGWRFALARLNDGTVRSWGANDSGQLGIGNTLATTGVQVVEPATHIRSIAAGATAGFAMDVDGRLWGWGNNGSQQLGSEEVGVFPSPRWTTQFPGALAAATGTFHAIVLAADGSVWAMGNGSAAVPGGYTTGSLVSGLAIADQSVLLADPDADGLPTWRELAHGTDPLSADSNGNGIPDNIEIDLANSGANADDDGDGVSSAAELLAGTDPFLADTDGDGYNDKVDAFPLDPTRHAPLPPVPGDTTPPVITLTEPTNAIPLN